MTDGQSELYHAPFHHNKWGPPIFYIRLCVCLPPPPSFVSAICCHTDKAIQAPPSWNFFLWDACVNWMYKRHGEKCGAPGIFIKNDLHASTPQKKTKLYTKMGKSISWQQNNPLAGVCCCILFVCHLFFTNSRLYVASSSCQPFVLKEHIQTCL